MARLLTCCFALVLCVAAGASAQPARSLESPFRDSILRPDAARGLMAAPNYWGGPVTSATGEQVTIFVSDTYPQDPAFTQHWADHLAGLLHGPELANVDVFLAPLYEVRSVCGAFALACYSPEDSLLIAPGDGTPGGLSAEGVVAHEYGHHVAANRENAPWAAIDYGTKRWATHLQVCARTRSGEFHPGAEDSRYTLNPGEAFAEAYRVVNERRLGRVESPWSIVAQTFYPDERALTLVEQDVTTPWAATAARVRTGVLTKKVRSRTITVSTPLDGNLRVTMTAPAKARFAVELLTGSGARVARGVAGRQPTSLTATICGGPVHRLRVSRLAGAGRFRLSITTP